MVDRTAQLRILARVRKLMALANDAGATEGERDNAIRMAHATLAKYNLTLGDTESEEEKRVLYTRDFLGKPWCINIAAAIARLYFCEYYYQTIGGNAGPAQKARHCFIGKLSNVTTAHEMAEFIVTAVNKEAQRYQRSIGGRYQEYRAFAQGAAFRIAARCNGIKKDAETVGLIADESDGSTGTALVVHGLYVREQNANKALMESMKISLGKGRSQSIDYSQREARSAGARFGNSVQLQRTIK
jgi:hypothetical protein